MNLMTESLWGDEAFSALAVQKNLFSMLAVVMKDTAPPLFYLVGYAWGHLFGYSEVALRSLTLLLMIGTAIFAGLIVQEIDKDKIKALLAGGVVFFSPFLFRFAFEWRMYALLALAITASTYFFVAKKWGWYALFALMALYTHHFAVFTVLAQGVWFLATGFSWHKRSRWLKELRPFLIVGLGYSFWLYPMYLQIQRVKGSGFWLAVPKLADLSGLIYRFASGGAAWHIPVATLGLVLLLVKDWQKVWKNWLGLLF
ncbi:MAG TPA: hypothetical protein VI791_04430, partial [Patescibacteria group bacterium]|nr:hypothetical protein [Patescibacteria group bacterium]